MDWPEQSVTVKPSRSLRMVTQMQVRDLRRRPASRDWIARMTAKHVLEVLLDYQLKNAISLPGANERSWFHSASSASYESTWAQPDDRHGPLVRSVPLARTRRRVRGDLRRANRSPDLCGLVGCEQVPYDVQVIPNAFCVFYSLWCSA